MPMGRRFDYLLLGSTAVVEPLPAAEAQAQYVHRFHLLSEAARTRA